MSWIKNYLFGEYSDESVVPYSYEGTAICDSYEQPVSNTREEEVVSGIRYRDNAVQLDLNIPVEDPYGYGGEPSFVQQDYGYDYGGEQPFAQQDYGYGGEQHFVPQNYSHGGDGGEPVEPLDDAEGSYPIIVSFETDRVFSSRKELVGWVQKRGLDHGYVITIKRSKESAIWFQCSFGGKYNSVATVRKTGSKKTGCLFELQGSFVSKGSFWRLAVKNQKHNHTPIENLEGHAFARRLSAEDKRLVGELADQNIPARSIWTTLAKKNPEKKVITKDIHNVVQKINAEKRVGQSPMQQLENFLAGKEYTYYTRENQTTNAVEDIFFIHKHSYLNDDCFLLAVGEKGQRFAMPSRIALESPAGVACGQV